MLTMQKHPVSSAWRESQDTEISLLPTPHPKRKLDIHLLEDGYCLRGNVPKLYHYSPVTFLNGKKKTLKTEHHHIERDEGQGRINHILAQILQNEVETPIIFKILIWSLLISAIVMESLIKGHAEAPRGNIKLGN